MMEFLLAVSQLKAIPRSGWISHGVSLADVESVAAHSFSTCALSILIADLESKARKRIDFERVLRMAVFHDLSEALTFDISKAYLGYLGRRGQKMKDEIEASAWKRIMSGLRDDFLRRRYGALYEEYLAGRTVEAQIVHAADALDILLQVLAFRKMGYPSFALGPLWYETSRKLAHSRISSARQIRKLIVSEARNLRAKQPA